jgi:hypothetical protein
MNNKLMILALLLAGTMPIPAEQLSLTVVPPRIHNRHPVLFTDANRAALRFDEQSGDGLAWWPETRFADGTIEFDARGKDVFQKSFLGIAFHGVDERTYDAVYFRPFNFRTADPARRNHAVQYIAMPDYDWQLLRGKFPEKYEKPVSPVPAPDGWFHARIVVAFPKVSVFVNEANEPCLVVEKLSGRKSGWIGLWVGNGSGGDFANIRVIPRLK